MSYLFKFSAVLWLVSYQQRYAAVSTTICRLWAGLIHNWALISLYMHPVGMNCLHISVFVKIHQDCRRAVVPTAPAFAQGLPFRPAKAEGKFLSLHQNSVPGVLYFFFSRLYLEKLPVAFVCLELPLAPPKSFSSWIKFPSCQSQRVIIKS